MVDVPRMRLPLVWRATGVLDTVIGDAPAVMG